MASNTFTQNIGCKETTRGSFLAYCYSTTSPGSDDFYTQDEYLDHQALTGKDSALADKVKFFRTVDYSSYSANNYVYSYGGSFGTITYNMEQVMITSNSFTSNYGGNEGAILSIEGFPFISVQSTTFTNNGNNIPDFQALYSTIVNNVQSSSTVSNLFKNTIVDDVYLSFYAFKMETILNIDMTNTLSLGNLVFNNNWVIDIQTSKTTSHSIRVRNMYKSFNCLNCQFTNNKGISNDPILTVAPNTVNFSFLKKGMQTPLINFANYFFSTFTLTGTTKFENNAGDVDGTTTNGYLFNLQDTVLNFALDGVYTSITTTANFTQNYLKSSQALFLANVRTVTLTSCIFTNNGYDTTGASADLAANLLYFTILEGYSYQIISSQFTSNRVSVSPISVTEQATISATSPGMINFLIQSTTFTSNQGTDNGGSFIIGKNLWLNIHITGCTFNGNIYSNHLIGDIYKLRVSSTTYTNIESTKVAGITASVLHKSHEYILEYDDVTVECSFTGVTSSALQTSLSTGDSSVFTKQTLFVLSGSGANTFTKLKVSN